MPATQPHGQRWYLSLCLCCLSIICTLSVLAISTLSISITTVSHPCQICLCLSCLLCPFRPCLLPFSLSCNFPPITGLEEQVGRTVENRLSSSAVTVRRGDRMYQSCGRSHCFSEPVPLGTSHVLFICRPPPSLSSVAWMVRVDRGWVLLFSPIGGETQHIPCALVNTFL